MLGGGSINNVQGSCPRALELKAAPKRIVGGALTCRESV